MKKIAQILILIFILTVLVVPTLSLAQSESKTSDGLPTLVPCGLSDKTGKIDHPCGFKDFLGLINNLIDFVLFRLALPLAAIMFAYAGFRMVTAPGGEGRSVAKKVFFNTVLGILFAAGAWLIVKTLLSIAGYEDTGLFFFLG